MNHVTKKIRPVQLLSPDEATRSQLMKCNLLVLPMKTDPRLPVLKAHRPAGCRLNTVRHPCRRSHEPILLTFEKDPEEEAKKYLSANRQSTKPFFMQSVYDLYSSPAPLMVTTKRMAPPDV